MSYSAARNEKHQIEVLDRIKHYLAVNKESSTAMIYIPGMGLSTIEGGLRNLFLSGQLVRRQVCLREGSSRVVWAYRLADQPESLVTFERMPTKTPYVHNPNRIQKSKPKNQEPVPPNKEKPHHTILRTLPLPRFEGYPELEPA